MRRKSVAYLLILALALCLSQAKREEQETNNSLLFDQRRFEKEVLGGQMIQSANFSMPQKENQIWLIYFSAPSCASCKRLQPIWDQVVTKLANGKLSDAMGIKVAQIDCYESPRVCERFEVDTYPTLRVLEGSKTYQYEGPASASDLLSFLENRAYQASKSMIDLAKREFKDLEGKAQDVKRTAERTLWGYFRNFSHRLFSLKKDSYLAGFIDWFFRIFGFGALSLTTKMVGFFMLVVAPVFLLMMMYLLPKMTAVVVEDKAPIRNQQQRVISQEETAFREEPALRKRVFESAEQSNRGEELYEDDYRQGTPSFKDKNQ